VLKGFLIKAEGKTVCKNVSYYKFVLLGDKSKLE